MLSVGAQSMLQIRIKKINVDPDPKKMSYYQTFVPLNKYSTNEQTLKKNYVHCKVRLTLSFFCQLSVHTTQ